LNGIYRNTEPTLGIEGHHIHKPSIKNRLSNQLKSKKVRIDREMTSRMTIRAKLSRRAVMKV